MITRGRGEAVNRSSRSRVEERIVLECTGRSDRNTWRKWSSGRRHEMRAVRVNRWRLGIIENKSGHGRCHRRETACVKRGYEISVFHMEGRHGDGTGMVLVTEQGSV